MIIHQTGISSPFVWLMLVNWKLRREYAEADNCASHQPQVSRYFWAPTRICGKISFITAWVDFSKRLLHAVRTTWSPNLHLRTKTSNNRIFWTSVGPINNVGRDCALKQFAMSTHTVAWTPCKPFFWTDCCSEVMREHEEEQSSF